MGIRTLKPGLPKKTTHGGENARTYAAYFTKQHGFEHSSEHVVVTIASLASRNNFAASQGITSWRWRLTAAVVRQAPRLEHAVNRFGGSVLCGSTKNGWFALEYLELISAPRKITRNYGGVENPNHVKVVL